MRTTRLWIAVLLVSLVFAGCGRPLPVVDPAARERTEAWSAEVVESLRATPVQHGGRVKPLGTLAAFSLYFIHGRRDMKFGWGGQEDKVALTPTEWLLDVWCHPGQAAEYPLFRIENASVFRTLWPEEQHAQRPDFEYLSYQKLYPVGGKLEQIARDIERKDSKTLDPDESALQQLYRQLLTYHRLHQKLVYMHAPFAANGEKLKELFGGRDHASFAEIVIKALEVSRVHNDETASAEERESALQIGRTLSGIASDAGEDVVLFPPEESAADRERWLSLGDVVKLGMRGQLAPSHARQLAQLNAAAMAPNRSTCEEALLAYHRLAVSGAEQRDEYGKVGLEAKYYAWGWSYKALHWFLPAFLFAAMGWIFLRQRWINWLTFALTVVGLAYLVGDVVLRCIVRERPPILYLYDTFLFIAAIGVLAALITEIVTRRRIALSIAPLMGALLIMLARAFEVIDGKDTMQPLQAVLDSNYWLATHVTTINIGYAAGMLAMLLADVWLIMRAFRLWKTEPALHKALVRMVYGVTCFGLLFAVFGTIWGGVWANDSWGRFWGWDPKENGALLICLSQIALLHARMSGMVRDFGFCLWAAITGIVVGFSWFGVNVMGVGLHSYGFSAELARGLFMFYMTQGGIVVVGLVGHLLAQRAPAVAPAPREAAVAEAH